MSNGYFSHSERSGVAKGLRRFLIAAAILVTLAAACSSEPGIDKAKFAGVHSASEAMKTSLSAGRSYQRLTGLAEQLSREIAGVRGRANTKEERELLKAYSDLLTMYRDGLLLWKYRLEFSAFDFVPKGRIYVGQDVEPIVFKYRFSTENHLYEPTGQYWKSISEDSLRIVWNNADSQLRLIKNMRND